MSARDLLRQAVLTKTATCPSSGGSPYTNEPARPDHPGQLDTNAPRQKKKASVDRWLNKIAAQRKTAARRPGRLDGDETLDKLAAMRRKKKD